VGSDGLIKTATTNLLLRSEEFNTTWLNVNSTESVNAAVAPDGTTTADKFIYDNGIAAGSAQILQDATANPSTTYTLSCFVKAAEFNTVRMFFGVRNPAFLGLILYRLDLLNGNTTFVASAGTVPTIIDVDAQAYGNGWYRFWITATTPVGTTLIRSMLVSDDTGDGTSGVYLWGAQLEQSSTVGEYIPTTSTINSAPRFDHDPTTGESLGLLVEESRTNLLLQSEEFDDIIWSTSSLTVTPDDAVAPDGSQTADLLTTTGSPGVISQTITKAASAVTYTASLWVKSSATDFSVTVDGGGPANRGIAVFDLSSGSLVSANSVGAFTNTSGAIAAYSNGWYRLILSTTTDTSTSARFRCFFFGAGSTATVWGAQLEAGSFPTSYIPTTSSTVTRAADVASISGSNFSSWYRQDEGTVFADAASTRGALIGFSDGTSTERYRIVAASTALAGFGTSGGSTQFNFNTGLDSWISPDSGKGALGLKLNNFFVVANGNYTATDPSGTPPNVDRLFIGNAHINSPLNGHLRRLTYWPQRLPDSALVNITS
jgi:hypothetical protein